MKLVKARDFAQRSLGRMASAVSNVQANATALAPSALLLLIRSANQLAARILAQPSPVATPAQRRSLQALVAQLRIMISRVLVTDPQHPQAVEGELAELIRRTFEIVDRVCAEPPAIDTSNHNVIDVDVIES